MESEISPSESDEMVFMTNFLPSYHPLEKPKTFHFPRKKISPSIFDLKKTRPTLFHPKIGGKKG